MLLISLRIKPIRQIKYLQHKTRLIAKKMNSIHDFEVKYPQRFESDRKLIDVASPELKGQRLYFGVISRDKKYVEVGIDVFLIPADIPVRCIPIIFTGIVHKIERTNYPFLTVKSIQRFPYSSLGKLKTSITSEEKEIIPFLKEYYLYIGNDKIRSYAVSATGHIPFFVPNRSR